MPAGLRFITEVPSVFKGYREGQEAGQAERLREQNLENSQQQHQIADEQRAPTLRRLNADADYSQKKRQYELHDKSMEALKTGNVALAQQYATEAGTPIPDAVLNDANLRDGFPKLWEDAKRQYPGNAEAQTQYVQRAGVSMLNTYGQFQYDPQKAVNVEGAPPRSTVDNSAAPPGGYRRKPDGSLEFIPGGPADPKQVGSLAETRREVIINNPLPGGSGGGAPAGYRSTPEGNLEFIPGGPADPAQKQRPEKPLPMGAINSLADIGGQAQSLERMKGGFQDRYGGNVMLGELSNTIGRTFGDSTGQSQWWQDYQNVKNQIRNKLFGSALTETERVEFEKAQITPNMDSQQIKINLARQEALAQQAARKLARAYLSSGYSPEAVEGALGIPLDALEQPREVPGYAPPQPGANIVQPRPQQTPAYEQPGYQGTPPYIPSSGGQRPQVPPGAMNAAPQQPQGRTSGRFTIEEVQ